MYVLDNFVFFVVIICCLLGDDAAAKQRKKIPLHELMTETEQEIHFGTFDDDSRDVAQEYIVCLPAVLPLATSFHCHQDDLHIKYSFSALGRKFNLELKPNRHLLSPNFQVFSNGVNGTQYEPYLSQAPSSCHYLHSRGETVAAISTYNNNKIYGVIVTPNSSYDIRPLSAALTRRVCRMAARSGTEPTIRLATHPHLVRHSSLLSHPFAGDYLLRRKQAVPRTSDTESDKSESGDKDTSREHHANQTTGYTLEVALFVDEAAYKILYSLYDRNEDTIRNMMLAYVNGVQAFYNHPSLGTRLDISLLRLELQQQQPSDLSHHEGYCDALLDSFCAYQAKLNRKKDAHHWDMALYLSGLNFFRRDGSERDNSTLGFASVGDVCTTHNACVISELGINRVPGQLNHYDSVYILAHEIGHNLGMNHDDDKNSCTEKSFIMSPSFTNSSKMIWSPCSAQVMNNLSEKKCLQDRPGPLKPELNHARYGDAPGMAWSAKKQCEVFMWDRDALSVETTSCRQLQCRSPHRDGIYTAGPAPDGTPCGNYLWCKGGKCVRREMESPRPAPAT